MSARARTLSLLSAPVLALGLLAGTLLTTGCDKSELTATEVPAEGILLHYDLTPGAVYIGRVSRRENVNERGEAISRSLTFTVRLRVIEKAKDGSARVVAKVSNLELNWNLGPNSPISINEFIAGATDQIDGATIPFTVKPNGEVDDLPPAPDALDDNEKQVLDAVTDGLTTAFYVVPDRNLAKGETWQDSKERGKPGRLGKYSKTDTSYVFEGLFTDPRAPAKGRLARLLVESDRSEETNTKDSTHASRIRSKDTVLFAVDGHHLAQTIGTQTKSTGPTTVTTKFSAEWSSEGATPPASPPPETMVVSDPCHGEYVGAEECMDTCSPNYMGEEACEAKPAAEGDTAAPPASPGATPTDPEPAPSPGA